MAALRALFCLSVRCRKTCAMHFAALCSAVLRRKVLRIDEASRARPRATRNEVLGYQHLSFDGSGAQAIPDDKVLAFEITVKPKFKPKF